MAIDMNDKNPVLFYRELSIIVFLMYIFSKQEAQEPHRSPDQYCQSLANETIIFLA